MRHNVVNQRKMKYLQSGPLQSHAMIFARRDKLHVREHICTANTKCVAAMPCDDICRIKAKQDEGIEA